MQSPKDEGLIEAPYTLWRPITFFTPQQGMHFTARTPSSSVRALPSRSTVCRSIIIRKMRPYTTASDILRGATVLFRTGVPPQGLSGYIRATGRDLHRGLQCIGTGKKSRGLSRACGTLAFVGPIRKYFRYCQDPIKAEQGEEPVSLNGYDLCSCTRERCKCLAVLWGVVDMLFCELRIV